jgi:hypothetical protein
VLISPLDGEKKKRLRFQTDILRFGQTEAASDFGSVCLAEAKAVDKPRPIPREGVPLGVRHLLSENTIVHTSIIRNCEDSWEKKKIFVPLSESFVPASEFFRNRVVFFRNRVVFFPDVGTPYTILPPFFGKKDFPLFSNISPDNGG